MLMLMISIHPYTEAIYVLLQPLAIWFVLKY